MARKSRTAAQPEAGTALTVGGEPQTPDKPGGQRAKIRAALAQASHDRLHRNSPLTKRGMADFLELFAAGMTVFDICVHLRIARRTLYQRRTNDPAFAQLWDEAREARYTPIEDRLGEIAETGDAGSMATIRAAEVLLKGTIARYQPQPRQQASATIRQTAEGGQMTISLGIPRPE